MTLDQYKAELLVNLNDYAVAVARHRAELERMSQRLEIMADRALEYATPAEIAQACDHPIDCDQ